MVRVQGVVQAGAQLSARAGETVTAVMAPSSKAIRTGWQTMPSPLLRYTPIPFPTDTARWVLDRHIRTSPLLCPIQEVWRKNKGKERRKNGFNIAYPSTCA